MDKKVAEMIRTKLHILLVATLFLSFMWGSTFSIAQERKLSQIEKKADRNFIRQKFDRAMKQYEIAIKRETDKDQRGSLHLKAARLYFMVRNYVSAGKHYDQVMNSHRDLLSVDDVCNYVDALRFQGELRRAEAVCLNNAYRYIYSRYQRYQNTLEALSMRHFIKADPSFSVTRMQLNTTNAEFWVGNYGKQPFYATSYSQLNDPGKLFFHRTRYYELNEGEPLGKYAQKAPRSHDFFRRIPIDLQNGPVSFTPDMQKMVATVINYDKQRATVELADKSLRPFRAQLFYSILKSNQHRFTKYVPVFPQETTSSYAHPFLLDDGKTLLFTSDCPGGYGGFDLYISRYDEQTNVWGIPVNLGSEVNTEGDEIFPVLYKGRLLFASNGLPGFGGYDLFSAAYDKEGVIPGSINHFPAPVNSVYNDYCMCPLSLRTAYFVSDREQDSKDDLYYLQTTNELGVQQGLPFYGMSEQVAISGGQLLLSGMTESAKLEPVELKEYAPEGLLMTLYFDFDSAELTSESLRLLQNFVSGMGGYRFNELLFNGFADEIGSDAYNYALSERRARNVSDFLRNNGIPGQFSIYGRGRIKLSPNEIKEEVGSSYWSEGGIDWIQVNRRARRVEIYNKR